MGIDVGVLICVSDVLLLGDVVVLLWFMFRVFFLGNVIVVR